MPAGRSQNLKGPLDAAQAAYRDIADPPLATLLPRVLDSALSLMGADFGNIQLLDPTTNSLRIVTQCGFGSRFLDHFAVVEDDNSACGRAATAQTQIVIADVHTDPAFAPHRETAAAAGFRAVQSTPLLSPSGRLVGMISTHFRHRHRPPAQDLRMMEQHARTAGQAIAKHLGIPEPGLLIDNPLSGLLKRLFSVGLCVASARSITKGGPADDRLVIATEELDDIIRDVQTMMLDRMTERETALRAVDAALLHRINRLSIPDPRRVGALDEDDTSRAVGM